MEKFDAALVVTHIVYRKNHPFDPLEGPYSSVCQALAEKMGSVETCQLPLYGFKDAVIFGNWKKAESLKIPKFLGILPPVKYLTDILITALFAAGFKFNHRGKNLLLVGIDPLSSFPLTLLKEVLGYKLVFYSVDFNRNRFSQRPMQILYEKLDEIGSRRSDQTWVVCESLKDYKKEKYAIDSIYIPNSSTFTPEIYEKNKNLKTGNKMAWTGSLLTERQFDILFGLLKEIQKIRNDLEFYLAPMGGYEKFRQYGRRYGIEKLEVLELRSRRQWQEFAATCDVGIAVYDDKFGSTEFIEPLKIWDFLLCGMPFIISREPSISTPIKKSGAVYFLDYGNRITDRESLTRFLKADNFKTLQDKCLELAREFDIKKQINEALNKLS